MPAMPPPVRPITLDEIRAARGVWTISALNAEAAG